MVSVIGIMIFSINEDAYARAVISSHRLLVITGRMRTGGIWLLPVENHVAQGQSQELRTLTWAIST